MNETGHNPPMKRYYDHYPLRGPAFLVARIAGKAIENAAAEYFNGSLLDIGCGEKWKQDLVGRYVEEYVGMDHEDTQHDRSRVDIYGTAYHIPVEDRTFDCVLCTAVLEHLEDPARAMAECHRVLKPGGHAIYTAPLFWPLHEEPRDFYRYTRYGLKYLFEKNHFNVIDIKALSGFWITAGAHWAMYLQRLQRRGRFNPLRLLAPPLIACTHAITHLLDKTCSKIDRSTPFTWMYLAVVKK